MAKGKATPASFVKGDPRASAAGKKSSRALPPELKEARMLNANAIEKTIYKYMHCTLEELKTFSKNPMTLAIDHVVIKILAKAIENGDYQRLNFLLDRTVGKVVDKIDIEAKVGIVNLHDALIRKLEGSGQESTS